MSLRLRHRSSSPQRPAGASTEVLRRAEGWIRQSLRDLGRLLSRRVVAYLLESHFVLHTARPPRASRLTVPVPD